MELFRHRWIHSVVTVASSFLLLACSGQLWRRAAKDATAETSTAAFYAFLAEDAGAPSPPATPIIPKPFEPPTCEEGLPRIHRIVADKSIDDLVLGASAERTEGQAVWSQFRPPLPNLDMSAGYIWGVHQLAGMGQIKGSSGPVRLEIKSVSYVLGEDCGVLQLPGMPAKIVGKGTDFAPLLKAFAPCEKVSNSAEEFSATDLEPTYRCGSKARTHLYRIRMCEELNNGNYPTAEKCVRFTTHAVSIGITIELPRQR
jgi:hypothetical protein